MIEAINVPKKLEFGSFDEIKDKSLFVLGEEFKGSIGRLKDEIATAENEEVFGLKLQELSSVLNNIVNNFFPRIANLDSNVEIKKNFIDNIRKVQDEFSKVIFNNKVGFNNALKVLYEYFDWLEADIDDNIEEFENIKNRLAEELFNLKEDATKDVENTWDDLDNPEKGKRKELVQYLKLLYFGDKDFSLTDKNFRKIVQSDRSIFKIIRNLEETDDPKVFEKRLNALDINNIADFAIKRYKDRTEKFYGLGGTINNYVVNYNKDLNNTSLNINDVVKNFRELVKDEKKLWVRNVTNLCLSVGVKKIEGYDIKDLEINGRVVKQGYISNLYDKVLSRKRGGELKHSLADIHVELDKVLNALKDKMKDDLLYKYNVNTELLLTLSFENNLPELSITEQSALIAGLNNNYQDFAPDTKLFNSERIFKYRGKKSTLKDLNNTEVVMRSDAKSNSKVLFMTDDASCDIAKLMNSDSMRTSNLKVLSNSKDNNRAIEVFSVIRQPDGNVHCFTAEAFRNNTVMNLDNFISKKKGGARIGLVEVKDGTTGAISYKVGLICDDVNNIAKNLDKIKEQYGNRKFAGPDGNVFNVSQLIDDFMRDIANPNINHQKDLPIKEKEGSLLIHRVGKFGEKVSEKLTDTGGKVMNGIGDAVKGTKKFGDKLATKIEDKAKGFLYNLKKNKYKDDSRSGIEMK